MTVRDPNPNPTRTHTISPDLVSNVVGDANVLDIDRLAKPENKESKEKLKENLQLWIELLSKGEDAGKLLDLCGEKSKKAGELLNKNKKIALDSTAELEQSYRSVDMFFQNADQKKEGLKNVTFLNATIKQLQDDPRFSEVVNKELKRGYDKLDLRNNYSLLIIPGYLGTNKTVDSWSNMAYQYKAMLVTDFENLKRKELLLSAFKSAKHAAPNKERTNTMMVGNWPVARGKDEIAGEENDMHISPAAALSGLMFCGLMSQPSAGVMYGGIYGVDGVRVELDRSDLTKYDAEGLIPLTWEFGKVFSFSARTLFNGDNIGLQTYSVVRVFDYIGKCLAHFLNQMTFVSFDDEAEREMRASIVNFLNSIKGPRKLIEDFDIGKLTQDPITKDIHIPIEMIPYFPAKKFLIKFSGQKGKEHTLEVK